MYLIKIKFKSESAIIDGFITQNKEGDYFPLKDKAVIFDNLLQAINVLEGFEEKYNVISSNIIDIDNKELVELNKNDFNILSLIISDMVNSRYKCLTSAPIEVKVHRYECYPDEWITIKWGGISIVILDNLSIDVNVISSTTTLLVDDSLLRDIVKLISLYKSRENYLDWIRKYRDYKLEDLPI